MDCRQTVEIEPLLRRLTAPPLIVWGTGDVFFDIEWAHWLRETILGAEPVVELPGAKLFFPFEQPARLSSLLRRHWGAGAGAGPAARLAGGLPSPGVALSGRPPVGLV